MDIRKSTANVEESPPLYTKGTQNNEEGSTDSIYELKVRVVNDALQEVGMGRYQWCVNSGYSLLFSISGDRYMAHRRLFVVTGFGYFSYVVYHLTSNIRLSCRWI